MMNTLPAHAEQISVFRRKWDFRELAVFGAILQPEFDGIPSGIVEILETRNRIAFIP